MTLISEIEKFVVFDTETTGVDRENDRIVTAYAGLMDRSGNLLGSRSWIIDPGIEIPEGAAAVHGITTERARAEGADPRVAVQQIVDLLEGRIARGTPIVAYNLPYDAVILDRDSRRNGGLGFDSTGMLAIDPYVIDKAVDKWRKGKRTLEVTSAHYGVPLLGAHDAEADAVATGRVAWAVMSLIPAWAARYCEPGSLTTVEELMAEQVKWAREQGTSFQSYLRSDKNPKGADPTAVIDYRWPLPAFGEELAA